MSKDTDLTLSFSNAVDALRRIPTRDPKSTTSNFDSELSSPPREGYDLVGEGCSRRSAHRYD